MLVSGNSIMLVSGNMYVGVGRRAFMSGYIHFAHFLHFTHFVHFTHCLCTFCALFTHFIQFRHFVHCSHFDMARMHRRIFWRTFYALFTHFLRTFYALLVHFLRTLRNLPSLLALYALFTQFLRTFYALCALYPVEVLCALFAHWHGAHAQMHFWRTFYALFAHFLRTFCARFTHLLRTHFLRTFYALLRTFCALFTRFTQFRHAPFACATWRAWRMHRRIFAALFTHFLRTLYALFRHFLRTLYALCALYPVYTRTLCSFYALFARFLDTFYALCALYLVEALCALFALWAQTHFLGGKFKQWIGVETRTLQQRKVWIEKYYCMLGFGGGGI